MIGERPHPVIIERARQRTAVERPATEVDTCLHECVVHGNRPVAVACDSRSAELLERRPEGDGGVLDEVMRKVATGTDRQLQPRVTRERGEHVIEKADARVDRAFAWTRLDLDAHPGLARLSRDHRHSTNSSANSSAM